MSIPNLLTTGRSGLAASKVAIATTGHNIANANTEGYSRQRVQTSTADVTYSYGKGQVGTGTQVSRIERVNDEYIEKQIRNAQRDLSHFEEKDVALKQVEDIFNEMSGDGLNRVVSKFFNEFRKLSEESDNPAVRQSVIEATQAMINDFHRLYSEINQVIGHIDSRIEGCVKDANLQISEIGELNSKIRHLEAIGSIPTDLLDKRDVALKKLSSIFDVSVYKDKNGIPNIDIKGGGPLISSGNVEKLSIERTPGDQNGKPQNSYDIHTTGNASGVITHQLRGGKLGALVDVRDNTLSSILSRMDELAYALSESVNLIHQQGFTSQGKSDILFFAPLNNKEGAAEFISLSDEIKASPNNIAAAMEPNSPGDNRIAIAISKLQNEKILDEGTATPDEWYNAIIGDVGVAAQRNRLTLNQQKDIMTQLGKVRDQISGVSIDEETTNLLQFQQAFDASAKVIQVADELLKTVLSLKRD